MIPLRDNVPASRTPVVNYALIGLCTAVFLLQLGDQDGTLIERFGMVPARLLGDDGAIWLHESVTGHQGRRLMQPAAVPEWLTLLTCTFLHGGFVHFLGNVWFLWIFGDNVEDRLGRFGYLCFYLGCGVLASATHLLTNPGSPVPTIGASGAIAGVMGAYFLLYPKSRVEMLVIFGFFVDVVVLPAGFFLGYWFLLQFFQGALSLGRVESGGVAVWAHIGGFAAGFATAGVLRARERLRPEPPTFALQRRRYTPWHRHDSRW